MSCGMREMVMMYAATCAAAARNMTTAEVLAALIRAWSMSLRVSSRYTKIPTKMA